jgi:aminopeptidase N
VSADEYTPHTGDRRIRIEHYDLTIDYRVSTNRLDGVAVVRGRTVEATKTVSLDLVGLRATKVRASGRSQGSGAGRIGFAQTDRKLKVTFPQPLAAGDPFELTISYGGAPRPRRTRWGTLGWEELEDGVIVASQPTGAPSWFPCNDLPGDKSRSRPPPREGAPPGCSSARRPRPATSRPCRSASMPPAAWISPECRARCCIRRRSWREFGRIWIRCRA